MNVQQLRKQAKELVKAARSGDADALGRLGGREPILARAQLVIAREHGYASWPGLVAAAEADAEGFVLAATDRQRQRAEAMLEARPEIERDPWAGLVLGRGWSGDPNTPGGPRSWSPLLYALPLALRAARDRSRAARAGRRPESPLRDRLGRDNRARRCRRRRARRRDHPAAARSRSGPRRQRVPLPLDGGGESRVLAAPARTRCRHSRHQRPLARARLRPDRAGAAAARARCRPRRRRPRRGCCPPRPRPECIRLLAEHGADLDRPGGEEWRGDDPPRTGYQHAVSRGNEELAQTLAELGASTALDPNDATVAAFARGERAAASLPGDLDPAQQEVLIIAAMTGRLEEVLEVVGPHFSGRADGSPPGTLLHHAAWYGNAGAVEKLLEHGADPAASSRADFSTPAAWAALGSSWWRSPGHDYVGVMEVLVAAGAELEPRFADVAQGPLADWFEDRGA